MPDIPVPISYLEEVVDLRKKVKAAEQFIAGLDWPQLKRQYAWLEEDCAAAEALGPDFDERAQLSGLLLNTLDYLATLAVNHFGVAAADAYSPTEEQE
jgi:hypothetical protein